jgi:hypothetical protein
MNELLERVPRVSLVDFDLCDSVNGMVSLSDIVSTVTADKIPCTMCVPVGLPNSQQCFETGRYSGGMAM